MRGVAAALVATVAVAALMASAAVAAAEPAAAGAGAGPLTARAVGWQGGDAASARLLHLQHQGAGGSFALEAAWLEVRSVATETYAQVPGQAAFSGTLWRSEVAEHTDVRLSSSAAQGRAEGFVFVAAQDAGADSAPTVTTGCATDAQAAGDGVARQVPTQVESPNPNPVLDLSRALVAAPCSQVRVCGALQVVLWERDASGATGQGRLELRSGQLPSEDGPDLRPALGRAQQLYLETPEGCLTFEPGEATRLVAEGLTLTGARAMALAGAAGTVAGAQAPTDSSVDLEGTLRATLERSGGRVLVAGLAGVESAKADGAPLLVGAAPEPGPPFPVPLPVAVAGALLVVGALAAVAVWLRRRAASTARMLDRMYGAADREDAAHVRALATQVLARDATQLEAWAARAVAHLDLQRFDESVADCRRALEILGFRHPAQRAAIEIVACRASSLKGDTDGAVRWLGEAYVNDLPSAQAAMHYPEVRRLLNTPGYS